MNKLSFAISKFDLMEVSNSELMKVRLWIVSEGDNQHQKPISWECIEKARPTLVGKPIVAKYDRYNKDLMGHEFDEIAVGVILSDSDIFYETDEEGKRWLCADGIIWCRYAKDVAFVLDRDQIKNLSMEIVVLESGENDSIELFSFSGITLIGTTPAIPNARVEVLSFSAVVEEVKKLMNFDSILLNYEIPPIVKQNAEKGISLKEINPKGITAVNISIANQLINNEFASLDLLHNIIKFSAKTKTETAQYLLGGLESLEWAENIINPQVEEMKKEEDIVIEKEMKKPEIEQENMTSDENTSATAQAELNEKQAEQNQELTEEGKEKMSKEEHSEDDMKKDDKPMMMQEDKMPEDKDMPMMMSEEEMKSHMSKMKSKMDEMQKQMDEMKSHMEEKMAVYMAENEDLKKFKADIEANQMMATIEYTLSEVMESMPKEKMEELREEAKTFSADNLNIWVNKVKAEAFSFSKGKSNDVGFVRIGLPFVEEKNQSGSIWNKIGS